MASLNDHVCVVTGASRGIGRGTAIGLGERGATVYITGRTLKSKESGDSARSLEATAAEINARGGKAIPVVVDHADENQVRELFDRIRREQHGRLDVLVNNAYAAVPLMRTIAGKTYWEIDSVSPGEAWDIVNNVGLRNYYVCGTLATRMMLDYRKQLREQGSPVSPPAGLIVNISSIGAQTYLFSTLYGVGKCGIDRMTRDMSIELRRRDCPISVITLWPGVVRTEHMLESAQANPEGRFRLKTLLGRDTSESPELSGRVCAALAAEPDARKLSRSGQTLLVSDVATEYGIPEVDGSSPAHIRSLRTMLLLSGYSVGSYVPGFIRIPKSWLMYALSWRQG